MMKHGFLITAYKNLEILSETINFLKDEDAFFFIHVDKKSEFSETIRQKIKIISPNVVFIKRIHVNWGGRSHLKAILNLAKEALKNNGIDYFHLLSGQCFPIKHKKKIFDFFEENIGKSFINNFSVPASDCWYTERGGLDRLELYQIYDLFNCKIQKNLNLNTKVKDFQERRHYKRPIPKKFPPLYGGSTWWSQNRICLQYALDYHLKNPWFYRRFMFTFCPEEFFFQTILANSPYKENIVNENLRYIDWRERNGNYPANLDENDFDKLMASDKLFARKFEIPQSLSLLERLKALS